MSLPSDEAFSIRRALSIGISLSLIAMILGLILFLIFNLLDESWNLKNLILHPSNSPSFLMALGIFVLIITPLMRLIVALLKFLSKRKKISSIMASLSTLILLANLLIALLL
ncbi:MAG: DUF1634 domain-containing protein [Nitrososphaerales archaeon]